MRTYIINSVHNVNVSHRKHQDFNNFPFEIFWIFLHEMQPKLPYTLTANVNEIKIFRSVLFLYFRHQVWKFWGS